MRLSVKELVAEYGFLAIALYLIIFFIVLGGVWIGLRAGWRPKSATGRAGTLGAAYIITKVVEPLRIGLTVVLTPIVGRWLPSRRGRTLP